jgi:hypothetical protein
MTRMPGMRCLIPAACVAVLAAGCTVATSKPAADSKPAAGSKPAASSQPAAGSKQPSRPASTLVPAAARVVTLSEVALMDQPPPLPEPVTITSDGVVRQLAAIVNRLQLSTAGAVSCGGGIGNALQLTFRARPGGPPLAVAEGPWSCGSVRLTINGKEQPALQITDSFIGDVLHAAGLNWRVVP